MGTDDLTIAYLAGALDADGYFTIKRSTYNVRVLGDSRAPTFSARIGLKQVSPVVANLLKEVFGGSRSVQKPTARKGQPLHAWEVTNRKASAAAHVLLPYLRIKSQQAAILIELGELKKRPRAGIVAVEQLDRWGTLRTFRKRINSLEDVAARIALFERIKALNDTRPSQPKLG